VLRRVFRGKFVVGLKQAFHSGRLSFRGNLAALAQPKTFAAWLRSLFRKDWVVYAKRPFGGPEYVLQYLGRYTHRVAISNHRLVSFTGGKVTFRWRDSAHDNEQKLLTLTLDEFLRRFLLHLLPKGFVRIRNFGFLANRRRARFPAAMLSLAWHGTRAAGGSKCRLLERPLALSQVWWTDGGRRKALRCGNPTSLPTMAHFCRMKRLSPTRILRASQRALSFCALTQNKTPFSTSLTPPPRYSLARVRSRRLLPCSTAQSPQTLHTAVPPIQFP